MKQKLTLVTGADGFIGSHLAETLVQSGTCVRALVQYNSFGHAGWLDQIDPSIKSNIEIIAGDIRDPHAMNDLCKGIDTIYHLASLIAIPFSYRSPSSYVKTNIEGTLNLLQASRDNDVQLFVHTSTSEVYGSAQSVPISLDHPLTAQSPYAATKIAADQIALSFYRSFDLPVVVVRPFNTYGPRQSARAVIPTIISQIDAGKDVLSLGNIRPTRDFSFVTDIVSGFIATAKSKNVAGEIFQFGTGEEISIGDLANKIAGLMNKSISIESDKRRVRPKASEVDRLVCDNSKAKTLLGWSPNVSLDDGLVQTIEWLKKSRDIPGYNPDRYTI